jgi:hypothetical protein
MTEIMIYSGAFIKIDITLSETTFTMQESCSEHAIKVKMQNKISYIKPGIFVRK